MKMYVTRCSLVQLTRFWEDRKLGVVGAAFTCYCPAKRGWVNTRVHGKRFAQDTIEANGKQTIKQNGSDERWMCPMLVPCTVNISHFPTKGEFNNLLIYK